MHKDRYFSSRQDDIWSSWQVTTMQPKPVARAKQQFSDQNLGLGVFSFDAGHHPTTDSR